MPPWRGTDPRSRWEVLDTLTAVALEQLVGGALVVFSDKWSINGYFKGKKIDQLLDFEGISSWSWTWIQNGPCSQRNKRGIWWWIMMNQQTFGPLGRPHALEKPMSLRDGRSMKNSWIAMIWRWVNGSICMREWTSTTHQLVWCSLGQQDFDQNIYAMATRDIGG